MWQGFQNEARHVLHFELAVIAEVCGLSGLMPGQDVHLCDVNQIKLRTLAEQIVVVADPVQPRRPTRETLSQTFELCDVPLLFRVLTLTVECEDHNIGCG